MKKIPTVFQRDPENRSRVLDAVTPGCEWVIAGEGLPTRKYDGTCVRFDGSCWWARREVKPGKSTPQGFELVERDSVTGKRIGWEPIGGSAFFSFWAEAVSLSADWEPGTYELVGPRINGNPEKVAVHHLLRHDDAPPIEVVGTPHTFEQLKTLVLALGDYGWEGIVWHHPDGRMAKLKARDFR